MGHFHWRLDITICGEINVSLFGSRWWSTFWKDKTGTITTYRYVYIYIKLWKDVEKKTHLFSLYYYNNTNSAFLEKKGLICIFQPDAFNLTWGLSFHFYAPIPLHTKHYETLHTGQFYEWVMDGWCGEEIKHSENYVHMAQTQTQTDRDMISSQFCNYWPLFKGTHIINTYPMCVALSAFQDLWAL